MRDKCKRSVRIGLCILPLLLCGCAELTWQHPEKLDATALERDQQECHRIADQLVMRQGFLFNRYDFAYYPHWYSRRALVQPFFYSPGLESDAIYRDCMRAKGWQLVPIAKDTSEAAPP